MKRMIINVAIAAVVGLLYSFFINYLFVPVPKSVFSNSLGNAISGFMSGLMGLLMFFVANKDVRIFMKSN